MAHDAEVDFCLVSRLLLEAGAQVGLMYRERPFSDQDSGWRFFTGQEDGEFAADPRNTVMMQLVDWLASHPEIAAYLDAPPGSAFERDAAGRLVAA